MRDIIHETGAVGPQCKMLLNLDTHYLDLCLKLS